MNRGVVAAERALDKFYNTIFKVNEAFPYAEFNREEELDNIYPHAFVSRLVVSDCAIIFIDDKDSAQADPTKGLELILKVISKINRRLIDASRAPQLMTTCVIDYGYFKYVDRTTDDHVEKSFFYGQTYVNAYVSNEKILLRNGRHGHCLVAKKGFEIPHRFPFSQLRDAIDNGYYDYLWMVERTERQDSFMKEFGEIPRRAYQRKISLIYKEAKLTNGHHWLN
jgi:hypothetical protein